MPYKFRQVRSPASPVIPHHGLTLRVRKATLLRASVGPYRVIIAAHVFLFANYRSCWNRRALQVFYPPAPAAPTASPLRFGVLGAAGIAPIALVLPVKGHPDAVVKAVAARDQGRADAFAKKHGIPMAYGGSGAYQSTWTMYSVNAGGVLITERRTIGRPRD
jgi:hypothetical protein